MSTSDNTPSKITGYKQLTPEQIALMNEVKAKGNELGVLISKLRGREGIDGRWVAEGNTDCQKGIMCLVRSIAQPDSF